MTPPAAASAPVPPAAPAAAPARSAVRWALGLFALAAALLFLALVAAGVHGAWFPAAGVKTIPARDLALARGTGALDRNALVVAAADASGMALVTANTDFRSADYPVVAWETAHVADNADVRFLWRTDVAPNKLNTVAVPVVAGRLLPVTMAGNPDWIGRVTGVALVVRGPLPRPVHVEGVAARPGGVVGVVADRLRDWFGFEGWSGTSINAVTGRVDVQELPLSVLLIAALALAAAAWLALARRRRWVAALPAVLAALFVAAWAVLDAGWTWQLARQVAATRAQFGGKDTHERLAAADDGALFAFVERARAKMPPPPARVFVVADAAYFRGRAAYHLYPHNVLFDPFADTLPPASALRAGDFLLAFHRRGVQFNPDEKKLRLGDGDPVPAEPVLVEPGAALFRIL